MALRAVAGGGASAPLTLASGTLTADSPALTLTQTWNNAAVTFTGYKINVTDTASASASMLMDLQIAGVSKFKVTKAGQIQPAGGLSDPSGFWGTATLGFWVASSGKVYLGGSTGGPVLRYKGAADLVAIESTTDDSGAGLIFTEMTAPSAPAANKVVLYAEDNGAGKTRLMARFPTGAAQQVAIEP